MKPYPDTNHEVITAHYELMPTFSKKAEIKLILDEALRRYCLYYAGELLSTAWVGLGKVTQYQPALKAGLMTWHNGETPPRGCVGWLILTPKGEREILRMMAATIRESIK